MPEVSIIIPNYNHAEFLQQRLDSVFNQTFQDFEVIILDDASSDGSQALIKTYSTHPKVSQVVFNETNSGSPFKQWRKGINLAQGEFIWIAESDDYCEDTFLETCLGFLTKEVGITYVQSVDVDSVGAEISNRVTYTEIFKPNIWRGNFTLRGVDFISKYLIIKNVIPNASAVVFKKELVSSDYFNEQLLNMKMCGDWFFWLQLVYNTDITFIGKDLNYFRHHNQASRNHHSLHIKTERLLEESIIREDIKNKQAVMNDLADRQLTVKWFKLHSKKDLFKGRFYALCSNYWKKTLLVFQFINYKIKN